MTQNGQGDEPQLPAVRPAHEGVVLPADGSAPVIPDVAGGHTVPAGGQPWGQPWGPEQSSPQPQQLPYQQPPQQLPYQQPYQAQPEPQPYAQPLPPESPHGAADATQYIAPVPASDSTQFLGYAPQQAQQPQQPQQYAPQGQDAEATQFIQPVPSAPDSAPYGIRPGAPEDRQPPAEFDSLFRTDSPPQPAGETQQLPRFEPQPQPQYRQQQYQPPQQHQQYGYDPDDHHPEPRRRSSKTPLIAAVVVGCAVIGVGVGALMSSGGDSKKNDDKQPVASSSSAPAKSSEKPAVDAEGKAQAVELDKLLAGSSSSRTAVINAVGNIRGCQNLGQAAVDLRGAANQRHGLVTQLKTLQLDKLAGHDALAASLTRAWNASASADEHYAAWADQVAKAKKHGCKDGRARRTSQAGQGDAASGQASNAKKEASGLWNTLAAEYGLTKRGATQL